MLPSICKYVLICCQVCESICRYVAKCGKICVVCWQVCVSMLASVCKYVGKCASMLASMCNNVQICPGMSQSMCEYVLVYLLVLVNLGWDSTLVKGMTSLCCSNVSPISPLQLLCLCSKCLSMLLYVSGVCADRSSIVGWT